ncbi:MAG TPA: ABC transporter permease [Gemmatimonadaceae bacterium]|nr:ABC transporter permease [Gemmatimonadaceae bacterium]
MAKLWVVFSREYLERVRSKWFVFGTLLGPVFFLLVAGAPRLIGSRGGEGTREVARIEVIDATGAGLGARIVGALRERYPLSRTPTLTVVDSAGIGAAQDRAVLRVQREEIVGFLLLTPATVAGDSVRYEGRNANSYADVEAIRSTVRTQLLAQRMEGAGIDAQKVAAFSRFRLAMYTQRIGDKGRENANQLGQIFLGYAVALLLYMMIVIYGQAIMRSVLEEKTTRVAEVVVSSVNTDVLLAGKILGVGLVAITQVLSWVVLSIAAMRYGGHLVFGEEGRAAAVAAASGTAGAGPPMLGILSVGIPPVPLWAAVALFCCFVMGFIFYASLFAAVGAMVNSQEDVQQAATPVMLLLVSSVVFMGPIMANPGSAMARTMSMLPTSAPIIMPLRITLVPVPWFEVVGALSGVAAACAAAIWLSGRIYRVGLLMYGKKPSFAELARWIRYAR